VKRVKGKGRREEEDRTDNIATLLPTNDYSSDILGAMSPPRLARGRSAELVPRLIAILTNCGKRMR
jgi:hypothetical protein